jgi:hypothetical protein
MKIRRLCTSGRVLVAVPVVFAFGLLAWAGVIGDAPARKPDLAHVAMVRQKQMAWLEKHPLLLRISRSDIDGVPGDMLTNACLASHEGGDAASASTCDAAGAGWAHMSGEQIGDEQARRLPPGIDTAADWDRCWGAGCPTLMARRVVASHSISELIRRAVLDHSQFRCGVVCSGASFSYERGG